MKFYKYQGTGNDFLLLDGRKQALHLSQNQIAALCHRRFGVGGDGLIILAEAEGYDFRMVYYNSDGRESSMCGNGGRCIVAFANFLGIIQEKTRFIAIDGEHDAHISGTEVSLKMMKPQGFEFISPNEFYLNTGSPHYVKLSDTPVSELNIYALGQEIRYNDRFKAEGTNVNFVNILARGELRVRTYERGVEDETLSCGTGVTACAYSYLLWHNGLEKVLIHTEGGELSVEVKGLQTEEEEVWLIGPAVQVFEGEIHNF